MEQTTQQISQKPQLSIKTKIVGWLMIILGFILIIPSLIFGGVFSLFICSMALPICILWLPFRFPFILPCIVGGLLLVFFGYRILKEGIKIK